MKKKPDSYFSLKYILTTLFFVCNKIVYQDDRHYTDSYPRLGSAFEIRGSDNKKLLKLFVTLTSQMKRSSFD